MTITLAGSIITLIGALFLFLGALGIIRMPDVYNRMQSGTKAVTLGSILFLLGFCFMHPGWSGKIALLILFIVFTNPVSSHALARAAHYIGQPLAKQTVCDGLREDGADAKEDAR